MNTVGRGFLQDTFIHGRDMPSCAIPEVLAGGESGHRISVGTLAAFGRFPICSASLKLGVTRQRTKDQVTNNLLRGNDPPSVQVSK